MLIHVFVVGSEEVEFATSLEGHTKLVKSIAAHEDLVASSSQDTNIRLWRFQHEAPANPLVA
jgi:elongator complex protein 2